MSNGITYRGETLSERDAHEVAAHVRGLAFRLRPESGGPTIHDYDVIDQAGEVVGWATHYSGEAFKDAPWTVGTVDHGYSTHRISLAGLAWVSERIAARG